MLNTANRSIDLHSAPTLKELPSPNQCPLSGIDRIVAHSALIELQYVPRDRLAFALVLMNGAESKEIQFYSVASAQMLNIHNVS